MKGACVAIILLLVTSAFLVGLRLIPTAKATTLYVGGIGPGNYTTIQGAVDAASPGDTVYVYNGTYVEHIRIHKRLSLIGEGRSNTTIIDSGEQGVLHVDADWVSISGFTLRSGSPSRDSGIFVDSSRNCTIENNSFSKSNFAISLYASTNTTIANNTMAGNGIYLTGHHPSHWNSHSIYTSNIVNGRPIVFLKNVVGGSVSLESGQVILANCTNVRVENLSVSNTSIGIQLGFSSHNTIVNSSFSRNGESGIFLSYSNDNIVASNNVSDNDWAGITLSYSNDNIVDNNTAANKVLDNGIPPRYLLGIHLEFSANNVIRNNNISKNAFYGVGLYYSNGNTVADNTIYSNGNDDIHLYTSSNNVIVNNFVASSGAHNIILSYSSNNTLRANNVSSLSYRGVHLSVSNNNTITENTLRSWRGITLAGSHYNKIFHNNMQNGYLQASDNSELNQWDDGYPSGGNYWSDYNGVDNCSGPNQDICPYPDGIGDTPYVIDADSQDRYPLMSAPPVPPYPPSAPRNLQATPRNERITLSWDPPAFEGRSPIANYTVYRGVVPGGETYLVELGNALNYTDLGLTNGQTYYYQVSARNGVGEGLRSGEVNATPSALPWAPTNLTAVLGNGQVTLDWFPPAYDGDSPITNYNIYRGTSPGGGIFLTEIGNVTTRVDMGLTAGQTYYYTVTAKNAVGEGPKSNEANATPIAIPREPTILHCNLGGSSLENITLVWNLSPDDGAGLESVTGYEIFRNETYDLGGAGYGLIAFLSNGTSTFTDYLAGEGNPSRYFYTVCAVDAYNNRACAVSQASKFARFLAKGPELVSIPFIQSSESIESVLQTVEYDKVWSYDSSSQEWKWYMKSKGYRRGLWSINHTMGLWVNVTGGSNLTVAGVVPAQTTIHLYKGWNLVSFPSFNSTYTVSDLKAEIGATRVEGYGSLLPYHLRVLGDAEVLLAGEAYWVKVEVETDWMIEVS